MAFVDMLFCFLVQNFAEIGQSVDELWPKRRFSRWRSTTSWIPKISIFGHVPVTRSISDAVYQISSKSDNFSLRYGDLTIFKMAAVCHLDFTHLHFLSRILCHFYASTMTIKKCSKGSILIVKRFLGENFLSLQKWSQNGTNSGKWGSKY